MKKILLVLSHDVEDVEALGTRALLRRAGLDVITTTFQRSLSITTAFGLKVEVDAHVEDLDLSSFDMLLIPGGKYVKETIDLHDKINWGIIEKNKYSKNDLYTFSAGRILRRVKNDNFSYKSVRIIGKMKKLLSLIASTSKTFAVT